MCVPEHLRLLSPSQQKALLRNDHYKGHSVGSSWSLGLFQNNIMYVREYTGCFLTGAPLEVLSVRLHSKSHKKSCKCQKLLTEKKKQKKKKDTLYTIQTHKVSDVEPETILFLAQICFAFTLTYLLLRFVVIQEEDGTAAVLEEGAETVEV